MLPLNARHQLWIAFALALAMLVTRGQHVADLAHPLPDASLAVFFLAGLYLTPVWGFAAFFAGAFAIDLAAVGWGGVSAYCLSPAYLLLVPAYGAMWAAGRWYARRYRPAWDSLYALGASLWLAVTAAEALASGGFYLFSGRFTDLSLAGLGERLITYFPQTLSALALYIGLALLVHIALLVLSGAGRRMSPRGH